VLTVFSIPKPFAGRMGVIQRAAVRSWALLGDDVRVLLVGDEDGVAEAARELGVEHEPELARTERGTPRLDGAFAAAGADAGDGLRLFVNADVVLGGDVRLAAERLGAWAPRFLAVGETRELEVAPEELDRPDELRARALRDGRRRGAAAIDWFLFTPGLFEPLPPFLVGRATFDNWLVWKGRQEGPVVDATDAVAAIHQPHDYAHLAGGKDEAYYGAEAAANLAAAGGKRRLYTIHDASHRLRADGAIRRNLGATLRARETARKVAWKLGRR